MLGGLIPSPEQLSKKAILGAVTVSEGIVMLIIAIFLDLIGLILFILSLIGVGIPMSWVLTFIGTLTIGSWATGRHVFRGVIEKTTENISQKILNVGGGLEDSDKFQSNQAGGENLLKTGGKILKTGAKFGITLIRLLIFFIIELIPFVNDLIPSWTLMVIFELVQGEA